MENNQSFEYTYCAQRQKEIETIRKKYLPREEDKMEQLRKLHDSATQKAQMVSLVFGVMGSLILGIGMCLCMTDLGAAMGPISLVMGFLIGFVGMVLMALAYPMYTRTLREERKRITPEILRLADELLSK